MENRSIDTNKSLVKNLFYIATCISLGIITGAAVYEHVVIWPNSYAAVPRSLTMFQGEYGANSEPFWKYIHPVTLLLFIITLAVHWKTPRRKYILYPLIIYVVVLIITFIFFVPELMSLVKTPVTDTTDAALQQRADTWVTWSFVRLGVGILVSQVILLLGLTKR